MWQRWLWSGRVRATEARANLRVVAGGVIYLSVATSPGNPHNQVVITPISGHSRPQLVHYQAILHRYRNSIGGSP